MSLQLIKSEQFGSVTADIYSNGNEMFMTSKQLYECLEEPKSTFDNRLSRNPKLKTSKYSVTLKMRATDGKMYNTRVFNENGIYEITLLSESEKGEQFRDWVRQLLIDLRKGNVKLVPNKSLEIKETNARVRLSNQFLKLANVNTLSSEYKNILVAKAAEALTGFELIPLPKSVQKTYSATEIAEMFGVSSQKIGRIANANGLKTVEYGEVYRDKSPYSSKEVDAFRYYDTAIPQFKKLLGQ